MEVVTAARPATKQTQATARPTATADHCLIFLPCEGEEARTSGEASASSASPPIILRKSEEPVLAF